MKIPRAAAIALAGGGLLAATLRAAAQTAPVVRMGAMAIDACGEAYYGSENGIFATNGISA
jgi:ABC-type nitrate/sulfonate/bicarbonate transport system substrate-binding protein